jgi:hypothetical protein
MIKPKYKKGLDVSQLARAAVEQAIGRQLTPAARNAKPGAKKAKQPAKAYRGPSAKV